MATGVYLRTPEMNRNMSIALTGIIRSEEHKANISIAKKGIHPTEEAKAKMTVAHLARWQNPQFYAEQVAKRQSSGYRAKLSAALTGKHCSEETKKKISIALTGDSNGFYGKYHTEESKAKMRAASTGVIPSKETRAKIGITCAGERNGSWRGGISNEPYPVEFNSKLKEEIRARDNYICQLCGVPEVECLQPLCCHHIDYNKENTLKTNLISLCHKCNGKVNIERTYYQILFSTKIKELYRCLYGL